MGLVSYNYEDVDTLVRRIKTDANSRALKRDLNKGLRTATNDIRTKMISTIPSALPQSGGLAAMIQAATKGRPSALGGRYPGVRLIFKASGHDLRTLMGARLWHPVFGNREAGVIQTKGVDPDVFPGEFAKQRPRIQLAIVEVMNDVARKVTR